MDEANKEYFVQILKKYRLGEATNEEIKFLESYYNLFDLNEDLITDENEADYLPLKNAIKANIDQKIAQYEKKPLIMPSRAGWAKYAVAASILLFISAGAWFFTRNNRKANNLTANTYKIKPGGNKATLTLAGGKTITLDDAGNGQIAQQGGVFISKTASGQIVYQSGSAAQGEVLENTVSTPNGGQYKIVLPDGTNVWLNAASSLTYPTAFKGTERLVTLNGEAYFEVTKNKAMPFRVHSARQTVEVLGTHFDINAYTDEAVVKTTLLEGSVKVGSQSGFAIIAPGEQAALAPNGAISKQRADLDKAVAWKNGVFSFADEDIRTVMRQVSRWYDIDVIYEGKIPDEKFFGEISRSSNLADVFKILELNNMRFDVEGKTVKVSYKK